MKIMSESGSGPDPVTHPPFVQWAGDNPYVLIIEVWEEDGTNITRYFVDLDEPGWMSEKPELMRVKADWLLARKHEQHPLRPLPIMAMCVMDGEQPYYTKRHIGVIYGASGQVVVHGIGKKNTNGHVDRLWVLPNGIVMPADDCDVIVSRAFRQANM